MIALSVGTGLFWLATRVDVYEATSPYGISSSVFGANAPSLPHPWWLAAHLWLRKLYSIVAFGAVGFTLDRALNVTRRPRLRAALLVASYSLAIEIVQRIVDPAEPLLLRVIDVACGAIGGWSGVAFFSYIVRQEMFARKRSWPE